MRKYDVTCSHCGAGFQRLELATVHPTVGEYRCSACDEIVEKFDGLACVAYRLTVQPSTKEMRN
jgi:hypothetical protein